MTKKYMKSPAVDKAYLDGVGWLWDGQVLAGDQWARYAPGVLVEVPEGAEKRQPLESTTYAPQPLTEPSPGPGQETLPESPPSDPRKVLEEEGDENDLAVSLKRPRGRNKKDEFADR